MTMWRTIPGWSKYEASNDGHVRRIGKQSPLIHGYQRGYAHVTLSQDGMRKTRRIAGLICLTFHGPKPSPKMHAAHRDGILDNYKSSNLRWATPKENEADKKRHGTALIGEKHNLARLTVKEVREIRALAPSLPRSSTGRNLKRGTLQVIGKKYGVSIHCIWDVLNYESWRHVS